MNCLRQVAMALVIASSFDASACTSTSTSAVTSTNPLFELDGTWTGQIKGFQAPGLSRKPLDYEIWMTIQGEEVDFWFLYEDRWVRVWNGARKFSIARHKSNAVIFASSSKPETECHWVETWTLTVSQFRPGSLEAFWYRVVNNTGCPNYEGVQFAYGATGTLKRKSSTATAPHPQGEY